MSSIGAGVDVSKAYLDVAVHGQEEVKRFTNDPKGYWNTCRWPKIQAW